MPQMHLRLCALAVGIAYGCGDSPERASEEPHGCETQPRDSLSGWTSTVPVGGLMVHPPLTEGVARVAGRIVELDLTRDAVNAPYQHVRDELAHVEGAVGLILDGSSAGDTELWQAIGQLPGPLGVRLMSANDESLEKLSELETLTCLIVYGDEMTPAGIAALRQASQLRWLSVGGGAATDAWGPSLARLASLEQLSIFGSTRFGDDGARALASLSELQVLNVSRTSVSHEGLRALEALPLRCVHAEGSPLLREQDSLSPAVLWY